MKKMFISIIVFIMFLVMSTTVFGDSFSGNATKNLPGAEIKDLETGNIIKGLVCEEYKVPLRTGRNYNGTILNYHTLWNLNPKPFRVHGSNAYYEEFTYKSGQIYTQHKDSYGNYWTEANTYFNRVEDLAEEKKKEYAIWFIASRASNDIKVKQTAMWTLISTVWNEEEIEGNPGGIGWVTKEAKEKGQDLTGAAKKAFYFITNLIDTDGFTIKDKTVYGTETKDENYDKSNAVKIQEIGNNGDVIVGPYKIYYDNAKYTGNSKKDDGTPYMDVDFSQVIRTYLVSENGKDYITDVAIVDSNGEEKEIDPKGNEEFYIRYNKYKDGKIITNAQLRINFMYLSGFKDMTYDKYYGTNYEIRYSKTNPTHWVSTGENTGYTCEDTKYTKHENYTAGQDISYIDAKEDWKYPYILLALPGEQDEFDLSLKKFISEVEYKSETKEVNNRVTVESTDRLYNRTMANAEYKKVYDAYKLTDSVKSITYTIRIYNEGNIPGKATRIEDHLPEGLEFDLDSGIIDDAGYKVSYNSFSRKIIFEDEGDVSDIAAFTNGDLAHTDIKIKCTLSDDIYDEIEEEEQEYDLEIEQYISGEESKVETLKTDEKVKYVIKVSNTGAESVYLKEIKQTLPKGIEFVKDANIEENKNWNIKTNSDGTTECSMIVCEDIAEGDYKEYYIVGLITAKEGVLKTVSEIVSMAESDIDEGDWKDYAKVIVKNEQEEYIDLKLEQVIDEINGEDPEDEYPQVSKGAVVKYKITVTNEGTEDESNIKNIKIADYIPDGMKFIPPEENNEYKELELIAEENNTAYKNANNSNWQYNENKNAVEYEGLNLGNPVYLYCVVTTDEEVDLKNIADIISFGGGIDIDSIPDNVNLDNYLYEKQEDDDDYTIVTIKNSTNLSDLSITTSDIEIDSVNEINEIIYSINVTNNGEKDANVTIKDILQGMKCIQIVKGSSENLSTNDCYDKKNETININTNIPKGETIEFHIVCEITEEPTLLQFVNDKENIAFESNSEVINYEEEYNNKIIKHIAYIASADIYDKDKSDWKVEDEIGTLYTEIEQFEETEAREISVYEKYLTNKAMITRTTNKINEPDRDTSDWKDTETICIKSDELDYELTVKKIWQDGNKSAVTVYLVKDGKKIDSVELNSDNNWRYTFYDLESPASEYDIAEENVPGYDTEITRRGNIVTIKNSPYGGKEITVKKEWKDNNDKYEKRPEEITVYLLRNGEVYRTAYLSGNTNTWSHTFKGLPESGVYTVKELRIANYDTEINGFTITNTYNENNYELTVSKIWEDNNDAYGKRPEYIVINLLRNGKIYRSAKLDKDSYEGNNWTYTFTNLPTEGNYTIDEEYIEYYTKDIDGFTIKNKYNEETCDITVKKEWVDEDDINKKRPEEITVYLLRNGEKKGETTLNNANNWTHTFTGLPGTIDEYTVQENEIPYYILSTDKTNNKIIMTNTYSTIGKPITMEIAGNVFEDLASTKGGETDNKLGVEDSNLSGIQVTLYEADKNGNKIKEATLIQQYEENPIMLYEADEIVVEENQTLYTKKVIDEETGEEIEVPISTIMYNGEIVEQDEIIINEAVSTKEYINSLEGNDENTYDNRIKDLIAQNKVEIRTNPTITDENGAYSFKGLDSSKKYVVEFTYNGLVYEAVQCKDIDEVEYNLDDWAVTSKATEEKEDRIALNKKFSEISAYENNYEVSNGIDNKVYLQTDLENNKIYDGYNIYELITNRVRTYMKQHNKFPNLVNEIYSEIISIYKSVDSEIANKLQFIEDCKINAITGVYPIYDERFVLDSTQVNSYTTYSDSFPIFESTEKTKKIEKEVEELYKKLSLVLDDILIQTDKDENGLRTGIKGKVLKLNINTEEKYNKVDWTWKYDEEYEAKIIDKIYKELNFTIYASTNSGGHITTKVHPGEYDWYTGDDITYYIYLTHASKDVVVDNVVSELIKVYAEDLNELYRVTYNDDTQSANDINEIIKILNNDDLDDTTIDIGTIKTVLGEIVDTIISKATTNSVTNFSDAIDSVIYVHGLSLSNVKPKKYDEEYATIYTDKKRNESLNDAIKKTILNKMNEIKEIYLKQIKIEDIYSYSDYTNIPLCTFDIKEDPTDSKKQIIIVKRVYEDTDKAVEAIKECLIETISEEFEIKKESDEYNTNYNNIKNEYKNYKAEIGKIVNNIIATIEKYYSNIKFTPVKENTLSAIKDFIYPGQKQIHLGIVKREEFDLTIAKDVYKVDLSINGNNMTYNYNDVAITDAEDWIAEVRAVDTFYERNIYATDYNYWKSPEENKGNKLEVYVTYRIALKNQTKGIIGGVTEIVDYYDSGYSNVTDIFVGNSKGKDSSEYKVTWTGDSRENVNDDTLKEGYITFEKIGVEERKYELEVRNDKDQFIYITFKVNEAEGIIADGQINLNGLKELNNSKQNIVEINGYKTYYEGKEIIKEKDGVKTYSSGIRSYNNVDKSEYEPAGVLDRDSIPGNYVPANNYDEDKKQYYADEDDVGVANGLYILIDYYNQRTIEGTVWEDKAIDELLTQNIRQGNGSYDEGEKLIQNVKATLMKCKVPTVDDYDSNEKAYYYKIIETEDVEGGNTIHKGEWLPVEIYTDENGKYSLTGFVPGEYEVWFTYDNYSINTDLDETNYNETRYNGQDFKSTIFDESLRVDNQGNDDNKWYLHEDNRKSDAKDNWGSDTTKGTREYVNNYSETLTNDIAEQLIPSDLDKYNTDDTTMHAKTDKMQIDIEYDKITSDSISKVTENTVKDDYSKYVIDNVDFGLVERPRAQLSIQKNVVNAKVVLADRTVLFDAIPAKDNPDTPENEEGKFIATNVGSIARKLATAYVETKDAEGDNITKLKNSTHVSTEQGRITMNMDEELMQGANLQVTYEITVENIGENDYITEDFYNYGTIYNNDGTIKFEIVYNDDDDGTINGEETKENMIKSAEEYKENNKADLVTTKIAQIIDYVGNNMKFNNTLGEIDKDLLTPADEEYLRYIVTKSDTGKYINYIYKNSIDTPNDEFSETEVEEDIDKKYTIVPQNIIDELKAKNEVINLGWEAEDITKIVAWDETKGEDGAYVDYLGNTISYSERAEIEQSNEYTIVRKDVLEKLFNKTEKVTDDGYNTIAVLTGEAIKKQESDKVSITEELQPGDIAKSDLILTQLISPDNKNDDLTYRNVLEIVKTTNDVGRRMYFSIAGNHVPVERDGEEVLETSLRPEGREIDTDDGELITIIPPFGANMQEKPQLAILGISLAAFFGIGVYLIKKKVLK